MTNDVPAVNAADELPPAASTGPAPGKADQLLLVAFSLLSRSLDWYEKRGLKEAHDLSRAAFVAEAEAYLKEKGLSAKVDTEEEIAEIIHAARPKPFKAPNPALDAAGEAAPTE